MQNDIIINTDVNSVSIILGLGLSSLLSWLTARLYIRTHANQKVDQSFIQALIMISVTIAAIMTIIDNNFARAFGLVGAVSIIRFRTKLKSTQDTCYLFLTVAIGMASGLQLYNVAAITFIFMNLIIYILWRTDFGNTKNNSIKEQNSLPFQKKPLEIHEK